MRKITLISALVASTSFFAFGQTESASSGNLANSNGKGYVFEFNGTSGDNCPNNIPYDQFYIPTPQFSFSAGSGNLTITTDGTNTDGQRANLKLYNGSCATLDQVTINLSANVDQLLKIKITAANADPNFTVQFFDINNNFSSVVPIPFPLSVGSNELDINDPAKLVFIQYPATDLDSSQISGISLYPGGGVINTYTVDYIKIGNTSGVTANKPAAIESSLSYFPNPVKDQLHVNYTYNGSSEITLSDMSGRVVKTVQPEGVENQVSIDTKGLQAGIYVLSVVTEEGVVAKKVVIQ